MHAGNVVLNAIFGLVLGLTHRGWDTAAEPMALTDIGTLANATTGAHGDASTAIAGSVKVSGECSWAMSNRSRSNAARISRHR